MALLIPGGRDGCAIDGGRAMVRAMVSLGVSREAGD
jgi:hypothetical protein